MKILVVGAGAVGGYYGAMLARAGHSVTFAARGAQGRAIREHGLTLEMPDGEITVQVPVVEDVRDAAGFGVNLVIVAVKSASLKDVAEGLAPALGSDGVAIPLENGLDSEEVLARAIGRARVVGGIALLLYALPDFWFALMALFAWALQSSQFEDLEREGGRILEDDTCKLDADQAAN